jgi:hypothetical protein
MAFIADRLPLLPIGFFSDLSCTAFKLRPHSPTPPHPTSSLPHYPTSPLYRPNMTNSDRIIVPLDVPDLESAIAMLDLLPEVNFWKVGLELFVSSGAEILGILQERQKKIFLDLKFHDIPNTVAGACRSASRYQVDLLTLHATAGPF